MLRSTKSLPGEKPVANKGSLATQTRRLIQEGLDDVAAGRLIPMENARAWADSLGTAKEHSVPRSGSDSRPAIIY
jgi:predicted transcriptional regulator